MQANANKSSPSARDEAKKFLTDILANGPMLQSEIQDAAEDNGIAKRTLERAKRELGIKAEKDGTAGRWSWRLPDSVH